MISAKGMSRLEDFLDPAIQSNRAYFNLVEDLVRKYKNVSRIEDSITEDEIISKSVLIQGIDSHNLIDRKSTVVVWGCWYGTILLPYLARHSARVIGIDHDDEVIRFAKNKLFPGTENIELITDDIFATYRNFYLETDLIINTACDHMRPMREWTWFKHGAVETDVDFPRGAADTDPEKRRVFSSPKLASSCKFAFQSTDILGYGGGINPASSMKEFKAQLPARAEVFFESETPISGGKIFTLLGVFN